MQQSREARELRIQLRIKQTWSTPLLSTQLEKLSEEMMTKLRPPRQLRNKVSVCGEGVGATQKPRKKVYAKS